MMSESVWQDWSLEKEPDCVTVTGGTIGQRGAYICSTCDVLSLRNMNR